MFSLMERYSTGWVFDNNEYFEMKFLINDIFLRILWWWILFWELRFHGKLFMKMEQLQLYAINLSIRIWHWQLGYCHLILNKWKRKMKSTPCLHLLIPTRIYWKMILLHNMIAFQSHPSAILFGSWWMNIRLSSCTSEFRL